MKKNVLILLLLFPLYLFAQPSIESANKLYESEQYEDAIKMYEEISASGQESTALYYNLGNAYYRINEMAPAILNYERALLLSPNNEDIAFNLTLAKSKIVDKINTNTFFLKRWFDNLVNLMGSNSWAVFSIITFILLVIASFLFVLGRYRLLKKISFFAGCLLFVLSASSFYFSKVQKDKYMSKEYAIVFDDTLVVKGSPDDSGTDLFVIHEGTKVNIKNVFGQGEWLEIQVDGNVGWVKAASVERI